MAKEAVFIGSDHAGFRLKEALKKAFQKKVSIVDMGAYSESPVDYPDIAKKVAKKVKAGKAKGAKGILICGTGTGMCMAANRLKGIRAAAAYDAYSAKMSRLDNDSNILCLRGRKFSPAKAKMIANIWLRTGFSGKKRHIRRIRELDRV